LAIALSNDFEVRYAKFHLTLGDSLLQKITDRVVACDVGIVVLTKALFRKKKWAENEILKKKSFISEAAIKQQPDQAYDLFLPTREPPLRIRLYPNRGPECKLEKSDEAIEPMFE
jgi:hypothetical protein